MEIQKPVGVHSDLWTEETLPYPLVYYPGMYAAYFVFQEKENSPFYFCSCAKESIKNHIQMMLRFEKDKYSDPNLFFVLAKQHFPSDIYNELKNGNYPNSSEIIKYLNFEHKLCHECNQKVPKYRYCHEMYGGAFKQNYGFYIMKQYFEFGVMPISFQILPEICPQEILELCEIDPNKYNEWRLRSNLSALPEFREKYPDIYSDFALDKYIANLVRESFVKIPFPNPFYKWQVIRYFDKQTRKVNRVIENFVREKFKFKKIGEAWTSETILYYIVESLYPDKAIYRHYRPDFLNGLELDIYIDELKIGIEYQGIQHFKPIKYWGGEESFRKLQERDKRKKQICDNLGIKLIYFDYDEELSDDYVFEKLIE